MAKQGKGKKGNGKSRNAGKVRGVTPVHNRAGARQLWHVQVNANPELRARLKTPRSY